MLKKTSGSLSTDFSQHHRTGHWVPHTALKAHSSHRIQSELGRLRPHLANASNWTKWKQNPIPVFFNNLRRPLIYGWNTQRKKCKIFRKYSEIKLQNCQGRLGLVLQKIWLECGNLWNLEWWKLLKLLLVLQEHKALHEKTKRLREVVKWKPMLMAGITWEPHYRNKAWEKTTPILGFTQQQGQTTFYKRSLCRWQISFFGKYAKCKRNDNETRSERTRKKVHMDTAWKFDNGTEEQHLPTHTQNPQVILHPTTWAGPLLERVMLEGSANERLKVEQASWCLNLLPQSSRKKHQKAQWLQTESRSIETWDNTEALHTN